MKISSEIASLSRVVGEEKAVECLARAGFDAWDFSMFSMCRYDWEKRVILKNDHPLASSEYLRFAQKLKRIGLDNGIVCNQSHAPFPTSCPDIRSYLKRAIECTAEAGGEICVIHPNNNKTPSENAEMYLELLPFAKQHGVKIATENMYNWDDDKNQSCFAACATPESFSQHLEAVNDDSFVACLDLGHAEMRGSQTSATEMIRTLGARLQALHVHDNNKWQDSHQIPFSMNMDFVAIANALIEIDYRGYVTLEADRFIEGFLVKDPAKTVDDGARELADAARRFGEMIEQGC